MGNILKRRIQDIINPYLISGCLLFCASVSLAANFEGNAAIGWSWYIDPEKLQSNKLKSTPTTPESVEERMQRLQAIVNRAMYRSVLDPTEENLAHYIDVQNKVADHAHRYTKKWSATLLNQPQLDYSLIQPTNSIAQKTLNAQALIEREIAIDIVAQNTGLIFFYRGDCPYCHRFAPILKRFAERYQIEIIAVSLDGGVLPDFPNPKFDTTQAELLDITTVPAVFVANPSTKSLAPIAYGIVAEDVLMERLVLQLLPEDKRLVQHFFEQNTGVT